MLVFIRRLSFLLHSESLEEEEEVVEAEEGEFGRAQDLCSRRVNKAKESFKIGLDFLVVVLAQFNFDPVDIHRGFERLHG